MSEWRVERSGKTTVATEQQIRDDLRHGRLSGAEMVRPPGATGWLPLHTLAVFGEEVPTRRNPRAGVDVRTARGWVVHLLVFAFVVVWAGRGTVPPWAMFWGIGAVAHSLRGLPAALRVLASWRGKTPAAPERTSAPEALAAPTEAAPPVPLAAPTTEPPVPRPDDFLGQVRGAVTAVRAVWTRGAEALGPAPDLEGLTQAAERLEARHRALVALHAHEDRAALEAELRSARRREAEAADAVTAEVFAEEVAAIADRLSGIEAAMSVSDQLAARKRTLLHQLAGLRLAAGQTAATHDGTEPARVAGTLVEKTATLRDALSASAEVDDALVRARRAAVAARLPARP